MTIASCDNEVKNMIELHSVVGAEQIINSLVRACKDEYHLQVEDLVRMTIRSWRNMEERSE